jgi:hypothetical protein
MGQGALLGPALELTGPGWAGSSVGVRISDKRLK